MQLSYNAEAYPGFLCVKRRRVFLLLRGWNANPSQDNPQH